MPNYIVNAVAGDFKAGPVVVQTGGFTERFKKIKGAKRAGSMPIPFVGVETIKAKDVATCELLTQENSSSVLAKAGWAAAGTLALGGIGLIAGALGGGNRSKSQALVTLHDGRSLLLEGKSKAINFAIQSSYTK